MNFLELANERHSTRKYTDRKVEQEKLEQIRKAGNIYGAQNTIIVCEDHERTWTNPYNNRELMSHDAIIATDHMMMEATSLGVDSVWVCWFDPKVISKEFSLPDNLEPLNILALGYGENSTGTIPAKIRKQTEDLIYHV